jgi:hypothetical protein
MGSCGSSACFFTCWKKNDIAMIIGGGTKNDQKAESSICGCGSNAQLWQQ